MPRLKCEVCGVERSLDQVVCVATAANQRLYVGTYDHIFIQP